MNSRAKGTRGEREFAQFLRDLGIGARRGQQFSGSKDSPDVITSLPVHFEVKRVESLQLRAAIQQAVRDSASLKPWVVAHRWNGGEWVAIVDAAFLVRLLSRINPESIESVPEP